MKAVLKDNIRYVLRFDRGEEVLENLKKFLAEEKISASVFNGIGACYEAEIGYYDTETKTYKQKVFKEDLEIASLTGNSGLKKNEVILHIHGVLSKSDFSTIGGHIIKLAVSATCEVFLIKLEGKMERRLDPNTNLFLL